ncbi:hypothetical protein [Desulfosporosinus sp. OT]|uniref:hypothetical protein n=1 Tax=Desulfosporosinus sp. OT TaxID=913865 RepID=UPI000223A2EB|nr:hypothetical protein [Desulfosporosinus sp. OT]EGW38528.1 hypothetical protein DOT_3591 [Desulfosporosinus sp. OT]
MLKKLKNLVAMITCSIFMFSSVAPVMASNTNSAMTTSSYTNQQKQAIEKLSKSEDKLVDYLKANSATNKNIKTLIDNFFSNELTNDEKFTGNEIAELNTLSENNREVKAKSLNKTKAKVPTAVRKSVVINDTDIDFYDNGIFAIGKNNTSTTSDISVAASIRYAQSYKDYYSWVGVHIFTVAQSLNFSYDGVKADYAGNYDGWYQRGSILSLWQVSEWEEGHYAVGNNYEAKVSGLFHTGFEYQGFGLVIQDLVITQYVTCYPNSAYDATYIERDV